MSFKLAKNTVSDRIAKQKARLGVLNSIMSKRDSAGVDPTIERYENPMIVSKSKIIFINTEKAIKKMVGNRANNAHYKWAISAMIPNKLPMNSQEKEYVTKRYNAIVNMHKQTNVARLKIAKYKRYIFLKDAIVNYVLNVEIPVPFSQAKTIVESSLTSSGGSKKKKVVSSKGVSNGTTLFDLEFTNQLVLLLLFENSVLQILEKQNIQRHMFYLANPVRHVTYDPKLINGLKQINTKYNLDLTFDTFTVSRSSKTAKQKIKEQYKLKDVKDIRSLIKPGTVSRRPTTEQDNRFKITLQPNVLIPPKRRKTKTQSEIDTLFILKDISTRKSSLPEKSSARRNSIKTIHVKSKKKTNT